jgi:hypothetical protein
LALRKTAVATGALLLIAVVGCSGNGGVESGATVTAYVAAPLCDGAKQELVRAGGQAGDFSVRAVCLSSDREGEKLDLAAIGANARRATEDSTTVAYLDAVDPRAARFTHPILDSAEIAWISNSSGKKAMARLLALLDEAGSGSVRESIRDALNQT